MFGSGDGGALVKRAYGAGHGSAGGRASSSSKKRRSEADLAQLPMGPAQSAANDANFPNANGAATGKLPDNDFDPSDISEEAQQQPACATDADTRLPDRDERADSDDDADQAEQLVSDASLESAIEESIANQAELPPKAVRDVQAHYDDPAPDRDEDPESSLDDEFDLEEIAHSDDAAAPQAPAHAPQPPPGPHVPMHLSITDAVAIAVAARQGPEQARVVLTPYQMGDQFRFASGFGDAIRAPSKQLVWVISFQTAFYHIVSAKKLIFASTYALPPKMHPVTPPSILPLFVVDDHGVLCTQASPDTRGI
jgi:hypothetical protein